MPCQESKLGYFGVSRTKGFETTGEETTFTIFSIAFLLTGVCLAVTLAVVAYPFAAFINYGGWLISNTRNPNQDKPTIIKKDNGEEKK